MTTSPDSRSQLTSPSSTQIRQTTDQNQGQIIAQMVGGLAVGQLTVYLSQNPTEVEAVTTLVELGSNPYQGLMAFRETDGDRFFGRDVEIQALWQQFQCLHEDRSTVRVLPIYGPSGSGKSSLARAGLIPTLGKCPLPGRDRSRVVVVVPGNHPLEALAAVLARIATQDPTPVAKTREFKQELLQPNDQQEFDGLRRIVDVFPDISFSPLIVLVDQFEEIYTLCTDAAERHAFVENLLCAASDRAQRVSIILTMRSDFLGATQQHPRLNKLFSSQGFLVPIMQPEELEIAITEPARRAGYPLDKATVQLLLEETESREAALPLLQFALTQIWEGLQQGVEPVDTLKQIGGVGGALASEAQRLYESLNPEQQKVARCVFLALVQLNDDNKSTRRRAPIAELITDDSSEAGVREVIDRFARPGVWILVTSCNEQQVEMLEVAHESLIRHWKQLQEWLKEHWEVIQKKRKIEQAALEWKNQNKSKDYLLQGRSLRDARDFMRSQKENLEIAVSTLAMEFIRVSIIKQRNSLGRGVMLFILPTAGILLIIHILLLAITDFFLSQNNCEPTSVLKTLLEYKQWAGYKENLSRIQLCKKNLDGINFQQANLLEANFKQASLLDANFERSNLAGANFSEAHLTATKFYKAILWRARFNNAYAEAANFQGADLENSDFSGAFLRDAEFNNSRLIDTDFSAAKGLEKIQILKAKIICRVKLPKNINIDSKRDCRAL